jgi:NAD+ synthase (glutamine-hydrolysing)
MAGLRIGLAQMDVVLGGFESNAEKILDFINRSIEKRCDLVVFPELALFGYLPMDLLERKSVFEAQWKAFKKLEKNVPKGISALVGLVIPSPVATGKPYRNAVALLEKGKKTKFFFKELLPNYDVFDDPRFFEPGRNADNFFKLKNQKVLVTICEDIWGWGQELENANYVRNPLRELKRSGVDVVVNCSASPFSLGHRARRLQAVRKTAKNLNAPVVYVNRVGGQDELIFDGGSFTVDKTGKILAQSVYFQEDLNVVDFESKKGGSRPVASKSDETEQLYQALVLGIRDFVHKTGFQKIHLGSSGGIDSALVAALACDAVGSQNVTTIAMPGPHSGPESKLLAKKLADNLGCKFLEVDINEGYKTFLKSIEAGFGSREFGVMNENLQSRLRGVALMAYSNSHASMLLSTGNKSEYATGYSTLYGDMCGGLAPIADLVKGQVYAVSKFYNRQSEVIPNEILERVPTAELRPNQKDQDTLPPYDELDKAIQNLVVERKSARNETEKWLLGVLNRTEFKRWQAPPVLRVSQRAFGRGRRYPLAHKALF